MTEPNPPQRPDGSGTAEWPSESRTHAERDRYGQLSTGNPYQNPDPYAGFTNPVNDDRRRPHVSFGRAVKLFFKNYAVFNGRASRSEYWWVILFSSLVGMVLESSTSPREDLPTTRRRSTRC